MMKFEEILETYQIHYLTQEFLDFKGTPLLDVPEWFEQELQFALSHRGDDDKEAYASEFIIVPFLRETWRRHAQLELFSHVQISAEEVILVPDYLLSARAPTGYKSLYKPLLLTVEAKDEKFNEGWAQALLQSVICQKINGDTFLPVYSIVTTGDTWQFGRLEQALFSKHPVSVTLQPTGKLLGILDAIFTLCEHSLSRQACTV